MKIRVYVGTTEGPVRIERITPEPGAVRSEVLRFKSTDQEPISADYDKFVRRPSGVIDREFGGIQSGPYRLDVSGAISGGRSWQLGIFVAHALATQESLAGAGEAAPLTLWLTGEVSTDLEVLEVRHVAEKLDASHAALRQIVRDGGRVIVGLPAGNLADAAHLPPGVEVLPLETTRAVLDALPLRSAAASAVGVAATADPAPPRPPPARGGMWIAGVSAAVLVLGGLAAYVAIGERDGEPGAPRSVPIEPEDLASAPIGKAKPDARPNAPEPVAMSEPTGDATTATDGAPAAADLPIVEPDPAPAVAAPTLSLFERRARTGQTCAGVQLGGIVPRLVPIALDEHGAGATSTLAGLCGLSIRIAPGSPSRYVRVAVQVERGRLLETAPPPPSLLGAAPLETNQSLVFDVPSRPRAPTRYTIRLAVSDRPIGAMPDSSSAPTLLSVSHAIEP